MTIKQMFQKMIFDVKQKDFWFSKYNLKRQAAHFAYGMIVAIIIFFAGGCSLLAGILAAFLAGLAIELGQWNTSLPVIEQITADRIRDICVTGKGAAILLFLKIWF